MRVAVLMWPETFEYWYDALGIDRRAYLEEYDGEWVVTVGRALGRAGADVHLLFPTLGPAQAGRQRASGATVHFVPASVAYRAFVKAVWGHRHWETTRRAWPAAPLFSTTSPRLIGALRRLRPDVAVVQDYESARFDIAAAVLPLLGIPVVGIDTGGSAMPSRMPWKRWTTGRARVLLAAHGAEAERARRQRRHGRVEVWPVPVRTALYAPGDRAEARERLGVARDARVVLSVGRLHPVKGLHELADACGELACELVLVGSGGEAEALEARGQPGLRLTGLLPPETVRDWYLAADVVALASLHEGQPATVFEALACGRGVVATDVGGVTDVVADGETGWLVPPRDVPALRDALAEALADPAEADRRGTEGRHRVVARHAEVAVGAELLRLLAAAARPSGGARPGAARPEGPSEPGPRRPRASL